METKYCKFCCSDKNINDFVIEKRAKDGRTNMCSCCKNLKTKTYRQTPEYKEKVKLYLEKNKEKLKNGASKRYLDNKEIVLNRVKDYYSKNTNKLILYQKEYLLHNKEKVSNARKNYRINNKDKIAERDFNYRNDNKNVLRIKKKLYGEKNKESISLKNKIKFRFNCDNLTDMYIKNCLVRIGFERKNITPELIELKRITLKTERLCLQLKNS